jgi:hypothetical protein
MSMLDNYSHLEYIFSLGNCVQRKLDMTRPETPYEAASYDLNKFRERRLADRRFSPRTSADRRVTQAEAEVTEKIQKNSNHSKTRDN